jgi:hypothetical protein
MSHVTLWLTIRGYAYGTLSRINLPDWKIAHWKFEKMIFSRLAICDHCKCVTQLW